LLLSGVLISLAGPGLMYVVDAVSYAALAGVLTTLRISKLEPCGERRSILGSIAEGAKYMATTILHAAVQIDTPDEIRGRVTAFSQMSSRGGPAIGDVVAGWSWLRAWCGPTPESWRPMRKRSRRRRRSRRGAAFRGGGA
jgi:hypothetical protein